MPTQQPLTGFHRKPLSHAILIACLSLGTTALSAPLNLAQAQTENSALHSFNIPAGNLETALQQFAAQSGISLAYSPERVQGRQSAGVQGQYSTASALQSMLAGSGLYASAQPNGSYRLELAQTSVDSTALPTAVVYGGRLNPDEVGHNNVYNENVTSVYQGREELQRFQTSNPGDVFKGMNGVYSMDTRSSQAITPNIRGITGEGRVPLTIDGTEQSTNVWLHTFGVGNRSYVDPALFRSIEVEKGTSLSRGIKSGVGGSVNVRTIEANDIIPEGDNWGVEANLKASSNTNTPKHDASSFYGKDYRDIPGASRSNTDAIQIHNNPRNKGSSSKTNTDDHSEMLTIAGRNEFFDVLVSRSERKSGNYYAGKNNSNKYKGHDIYNEKTTDRFIPNLTKLYYAGDEVFNTSSETDTTLIKSNLYFTGEQKIGLQFMRTNTVFGETTPGDTILNWQYREAFEKTATDQNIDIDWDYYRFVHERPRTKLRLDSYKIDYEAKPLDSNILNLEASLWHTKTNGTRYQTGAHPYGITNDDQTNALLHDYDWWMTNYPEYADFLTEPDHDGIIHPEGRQWTTHDRTGFDLSNQFILSDSLQLLLATSYQQEKLNEKVQSSGKQSNGLFPDGAGLHRSTGILGPRSGERKEYSALFNLSWQANDWLNLTAGTRYTRYKGKDVGLAKMRRLRDENFKTTQQKTGVLLEWGELLTDEENLAFQQAIANGTVFQFIDKHGEVSISNTNSHAYLYWKKSAFVPIKDGKLDSSQNPFANGQIDTSKLYQTVDNPLRADGTPNIANQVAVLRPTGGTYGKDIYERLDASQGWEMPEEQSGDAFSPVLSATARITPFGTTFIRYAQTTRFASINELTSGTLINGQLGNLAINGASKPERSTNWEIGYAHDLRQFFPNLLAADARISYYNTEIKDFFDRDIYYNTIQFDKKKTQGIELQSRFDSGNYFGSFGATYRLKQKLCDKDYASGMDPIYNRIPDCITGGFPGTYSGNSLQPRYSIDALMGTRLFNDRLELGWRSTYHKGAENKQLDKLLASEQGPGGYGTYISDAWFTGGLDGFYWQSVLLHDIYANYNLNNNFSVNLGVTNLTDEYYLDPMSKSLLPAPGRTVSAGVTINF
ncbi:TonB-dependent receptor [Thiopseudomonas denitrificans]|uniref:Hemoglobin/transferrin/lactoferrin receptor protein n=1 Tax=Thiopseudomonas denitrificans TaxID=1501432 RepID=A0A4R6TSA3_9GAMM|nr:TonB-dependent receptor [Thiopseudomonas denitrificans]TDQ36490.1 hemoglobin/transferrin/lactoferrin receptor protein [Thiopseudomonas denitrificans]